MSRALPAVALLFVLPVRAFAGPPFLTDDPETLDPGGWEINVAGTTGEHGGDRAGGAPSIDANYGLAPDLQLTTDNGLAWSRPAGGPTTYGYGDTQWSVKWRFLHETADRPQVSFYPALVLPTGSERRGFGAGHTGAFLPVWVEKSFGAWTTYGGGGPTINPGTGNRNSIFLGWEAQRQLTDFLMLGAEVFHSTRTSITTTAHTGFNIGGQADLSEHLHLLFSAGRDFTRHDTDMAYLGTQITF